MQIRDRIKEFRRVAAGEGQEAPGIYAICNTRDGKAYVGSAVNVAQRWRTHVKMLRRKRHPNGHLQGAWNRDGEESFVAIVLQSVENPCDLLSSEQSWIDRLGSASPERGYNLRRIASSNLGLKFTDEQKRRVSAARVGNKNALGTKQSAETIERRRRKLVGQVRRYSAESRARIGDAARRSMTGSDHNAKTYTGLVDPHGSQVGPVRNLSKFCRDNDLRRANLLMVLNGERRSHQGWTAIAQ